MNYYPENFVLWMLFGTILVTALVFYFVGRRFERAERRRQQSRPLYLPLYPDTHITRRRHE